MKANVVHLLALIHPKKKLINCQHPRRFLFFCFLLICLILSAWFAGVSLYLALI